MRSRANRLQGGHRAVHFDGFTDTDGTYVRDHPSSSGSPWTEATVATSRALVTSNRLEPEHVVGAALLMLRRVKRKNMAVHADIIRTGALDAGIVGICLRARPALGVLAQAPRYWFARHNAGAWAIVRDNLVVVGTSAQVLTQDQVYRLKYETRGPRHLLWVDGVLLLNVESAFTVKWGSAGLFFQTNAATDSNLRLDNFLATR